MHDLATNSQKRTTLQGPFQNAAESIRAEIAERGVIPFARFMELALYCPEYGFYEKESDNIGRRGDFFTSVSVGNLFGELLAFQFAEWLEKISSADAPGKPLRLVEAGAHNGQLAKDILTWLHENRRSVYGSIEFCVVEPSAVLRERQRRTLKSFAGKVFWTERFGELGEVRGIVFANELLDAMPVRRIGWDAARRVWFEWGVTVERDELTWTRLPALSADFSANLPELPSELLDVLPDGFTTEISPAAEAWWRTAADALRCGKLVTFDYGLSAEEFFVPERRAGTLRGYRGHRLIGNVLEEPGEQDITAHVNFSAIQRAGELAGLKTDVFESQSSFLTRIAGQFWKSNQNVAAIPAPHIRQFQTLTHPEHLGRAFRVLVQSR